MGFSSSAGGGGAAAPAEYAATWTNLSNGTESAFWSRNGGLLHVTAHVTWTGAGSGGVLELDLPGAEAGSPIIDTGALPSGTSTAGCVGFGYWNDGGAVNYDIYVCYRSTNSVSFKWVNGDISGTAFANTDVLSIQFTVPIVGWN